MVDASREAEEGSSEPLRLSGSLARLERASLRAGGPIRRAAGSGRLNPLPHAGSISVFLLAVVTVTGLYITLFFEYGFEASYRSVAKIDNHPIQSVMRALHRYSSAALVLTMAVHAWRIFVARRFTGRQRRWRWASGVAALFLVWLAGVTGYWLVWDSRAGALNEVMIGLFGFSSVGTGFAVDSVIGRDVGSGWTLILAIWFIHLGLTAAIGYFTYRHLRRSRLAWLPPKHWMGLMAAALLMVSLVFPVGMLPMAAQDVLVSSMPLDPFVLFLLPPLLSGARWLVIGGAVMAGMLLLFLPRILTRRDPAVVEIDDEECTGCNLCVLDCPYLALDLVDRASSDRPLAVVDPSLCVGCGICLGSCSFGAMEMPGYPPLESVDPDSKPVVIACARHMLHATTKDSDPSLFVEVTCTGMLHHSIVATLTEKGAQSVKILGCGPNDCTYGIGNSLTGARLEGSRSPHPPRSWIGVAREFFVTPTSSASALSETNRLEDTPTPSGAWTRVGLLVIASLAVVALATRAPFSGRNEEAALRMVINHQAGQPLDGQAFATGLPGELVSVQVEIDGTTTIHEVDESGGRAIDIIDLPLDPGKRRIEVTLIEGSASSEARTLIYSGVPDVANGSRVFVEIIDTPTAPGVDEGKDIFNSRSGGACNVCHSVKPGDDGVGPSLAGIGTTGSERIIGLSAPDYIRQSILSPNAYIADGYRPGQMLEIYQDRLSETDLDALVQYVSSLTEE